MTGAAHDLARRFFAALSAGAFPDGLLADEITTWTTTSGPASDKARYEGGVKLLSSLFPRGLPYTVDSLTAEDDRVAAEVHAEGTLANGELFQNRYAFVLRIKHGRIASIAEHFDPGPVREKIVPLLMAAMAKPAS